MSKIKIEFYLNNEKIKDIVDLDITLLDYLRDYRGLTGTKRGCNEGDCGACTVAIGEKINNKIVYRAINSCIYPIIKAHNKHIITVEGLDVNNELHEIQKAMIKNNAVQCGFCSPGIIMSLFCLYMNNKKPNEEDINKALEGNLCRCTGYISIKKAAKSIDSKNVKMLYLSNINLKENKLFTKEDSHYYFYKNYYVPKSLKEYFKIKNKGQIINGGTDIYVNMNIRKETYENITDISKIKELNFIKIKKSYIEIGGNIRICDIIENRDLNNIFPEFINVLRQIGSTQIRNIATITGNIANASPIADSAVFLLAMNSELTLISKSSERKILLKDFYKSYKNTQLKNSELIKSIKIPFNYDYKLFLKTARRKVLDIASVNSAIAMNIKNNKIIYINIALGGVKEIPFISYKTNNYLLNKNIKKINMKELLYIIIKDISPISDVRASEDDRKEFIKNHIIKHFNEILNYEKY